MKYMLIGLSILLALVVAVFIIIQLIPSREQPETVQSLAKRIDHHDKEIREEAALALGTIGSSECIEPMLKALADEDEYVRSRAMRGIDRGIEAEQCTKDFLDAMFPALTKLLNRPDGMVSGRAPKLLLIIDTDRAIPVLLSPEYFTSENREVHYILRALNQAGHKIPHDKLLPFLKVVKPLTDNYPHDYEYAEVLKAYAHNPDAAAEETFRAELESTNERIQEGAAEALAILNGIVNARDFVFDALDNPGFRSMSIPQKHYIAIDLYNAEVCNGGHAQYFFNSSGNDWKIALDGLRAVGANERAEILSEATALFGESGPSKNRFIRDRELSRFSEQQDETLEKLDDRYFACKENVYALLAQYTIEHKQHFIAEK